MVKRFGASGKAEGTAGLNSCLGRTWRRVGKEFSLSTAGRFKEDDSKVLGEFGFLISWPAVFPEATWAEIPLTAGRRLSLPGLDETMLILGPSSSLIIAKY